MSKKRKKRGGVTQRPKSKGSKSRKERRRRDASKRAQRVSKYNKVRRALGLSGKMQSNEWVRRQLSNATSGRVSVFGEGAVRSFWALTRDIWNRDDVPSGQRLDRVMEFFGTNNLEDAMVRAFVAAGDVMVERVGRSLDIHRYSVNSFFGHGFFSVG